MRNFAIAALSLATAISGVSPAYAYPTMSANGSSGGLVIEVVDHGHDWKGNLQDDPIPNRRHDNRHHDDRHHDSSRNDHHNDHHHHNHLGEIIGGAAAGALIGGALAPQRREYDDRYDDEDDDY
ncbi:hypothetical protein [Rhizobium tubonense]|uniref:Uncharacterized protein n=1 Tax=Rhizobium tubonense TaxID=484088 RepID=A0A2W4EUX6_9HYPH|nr:hypothetical protein [Rhizobium tubonense]PZM14553.1 hypothetical protein CPY51_10955 [Rhizobium tubonense]